MGKKHISASLFVFTLLLVLMSTFLTNSVRSWSNGGYSADPSNPDYGTHDWIAQHALDWLPTEEKQYISSNLEAYLYGTELPDNPDGIGDTTKHHIYYNSSEVMTDDAAAVRASAEYNNTLIFLKAKDYTNAAKNGGIMSHYIVDMAVFGHVMGASTDWGTETHHSDYEDHVKEQTLSYSGGEFDSYLSFDGSLVTISAYDAAKDLAYDTTFDVDGNLNCTWMDQNYNWNNPTFKNRAGESLNLAVNYLTDVLHTLYSGTLASDTTPPVTTLNSSGVLGDNEWFTSDVTVTLSATDDAEVEKTEYSFDNVTWASYTTPFTVTKEGSIIVYYKSTDKIGNSETIKTKTIKIDKTAPSARAGQDQTVKVGEKVNFDASGSADNVGIAIFEWDFGDSSTGMGMTTARTFAQAGNYNVTLTVKDSAGNTSKDTLTVTVLTSTEAFPMWAIGIAVLLIAAIAIGTIAIIKRKT
jgi:plastocyanin